jgi:hypothetical protein
MANIDEKIIFDDSQVIKSFTDQFDLITKADKAVRDLELSYKEAFEIAQKQLDDTNKAVENGNKAIGKHIAATTQAKASNTSWRDSLRSVANEVNVMGVNLGGVITNLKTKAQVMKSVVSSVNAGSNALKVFKIALISTGIGAIVVALGSFVALLTKSEKAVNVLNQVLAAIGATINVVIDRAVKLGGAIVKVFQGDFKGAFGDAKASVAGLTAEIVKEAGAAIILEKRLQALADANRDLIVTNEKRKSQISELLLLASDQAAADKDRVSALKQAAEVQKQIDQDAVRAARENFEIIKQQQQARSEETRDKQALAEAEANFIMTQREANENQIGFTRRITGLEEEQRSQREAAHKERMEQIKAANEALNEQIDKILDAAAKARLEGLDPAERLFAEAELAKAQIDELFKVLDEKAKAAGKEIDLTEEKADILKGIEANLAEELKKIRDAAADEDRAFRLESAKDRYEFERAEAKKRLELIGEEMQKGAEEQLRRAEDFKNPIEKALDSIKVKLLDVFDVTTGEQLDTILSSFGQAFNSLKDIFTANTEEAIEANEELIATLEERSAALDEELQKELERQEAGLANNVDAKRKEIETIKQEQEKAQKEAEKLRKKQLAAQIISDGISQGSNIITMASNILASPNVSLLGPAGIPVALAVIAAMIGIFSKIKSSQKKLYTGGPLDQEGVTGFVNKQGRTDRNGGRGHAVEDSNLILGGREFVVSEGPAHEHSKFLEDLNSGKFTGKDLYAEAAANGMHFSVGYNREFEANARRIQSMQAINRDDRLAADIDNSVAKYIGKLITVIEEKPDSVAYNPGQIIRQTSKSGTKIIKTEEDWRWKP